MNCTVVSVMCCLLFLLHQHTVYSQHHSLFNYGASADLGLGITHLENNITGFLSFKGSNLHIGITNLEDRRDSEVSSNIISNSPTLTIGYKGLIHFNKQTYVRGSIESQLIKTQSRTARKSGNSKVEDEDRSLNFKLGFSSRHYGQKSNVSYDLDYGLGLLRSEVISDLYLFVGLSIFIRPRP